MTTPASRVRLALDLLAYRDEVVTNARRARPDSASAERESLIDFAAEVEVLGGRETAAAARLIAREERA